MGGDEGAFAHRVDRKAITTSMVNRDSPSNLARCHVSAGQALRNRVRPQRYCNGGVGKAEAVGGKFDRQSQALTANQPKLCLMMWILVVDLDLRDGASYILRVTAMIISQSRLCDLQ